VRRLIWLLVGCVTAGFVLLGIGETLGEPPVGAAGCLVLGAASVLLSVLIQKQMTQEARKHRPRQQPPRVDDDTARGWVQVGVGVAAVALSAGLFVCWLVLAWHRSGVVQSRFWVRRTMTVENVRIERISREIRTGGAPGVLSLMVTHRDQTVVCEFQPQTAPWTLQAGDTVSIRGTVRRAEPETGYLLLEGCKVLAQSSDD
jgi:hypothetical protein